MSLLDKARELWPDQCPECGGKAWIGPFQVTCIYPGCRHGSEAEWQKYFGLVTKWTDEALANHAAVEREYTSEWDEDTEPQGRLPWFDWIDDE
jgi:hypothetical protein